MSWKAASCEVRKMIADFLATKEMSQADFLIRIGCSSSSYQKFLKVDGPHSGTSNAVYSATLKFFQERMEKENQEKAKDPVKHKRKLGQQKDEKRQRKPNVMICWRK
jgi:thiamine pyrophosphate-dependent acetolactate synthase large subunit-like protein